MSTEILASELDKLNSKEIELLISHMKPKHTEEIKSELKKANLNFNITFLEDGMVLNI